jgi:hypothetical protein
MRDAVDEQEATGWLRVEREAEQGDHAVDVDQQQRNLFRHLYEVLRGDFLIALQTRDR